jgi:hypothetical protein
MKLFKVSIYAISVNGMKKLFPWRMLVAGDLHEFCHKFNIIWMIKSIIMYKLSMILKRGKYKR